MKINAILVHHFYDEKGVKVNVPHSHNVASYERDKEIFSRIVVFRLSQSISTDRHNYTQLVWEENFERELASSEEFKRNDVNTYMYKHAYFSDITFSWDEVKGVVAHSQYYDV